MREESKISRRSFLKNSALAGAIGTVGAGNAVFLTSCEGKNKLVPLREPGTYYTPELPDLAADGKPLKAGVVGCGGRGTGAAINFLSAANGVTVVALGDTFADRVESCAEALKKEKNIDIAADRKFVGLDAYKKVIDSDIDVLITATPPCFRPEIFRYAVEKGKHAFLEKPVCVDAAGYRTIVAASKQAQAKGLSVVTGTQRHHERGYVESYKKVMEGLIGEITGGNVYWNGGELWSRYRQKGWSDLEWMIRDWVNWTWLSGDHIVEQHVHNIDVFTWFSGLRPISAVGFGSRQRRQTGNQYDNFSVDFEFENGIHLHSMSRQISNCSGNVSEIIHGTKGVWYSEGRIEQGEADETGKAMEKPFQGKVIKNLKGEVIWKYDREAEKATYKQRDPYTLEHVNWINHIRSGKPIEQASETAVSNMAAIMGRESAYTGKLINWDDMTAAAQNLIPEDLDFVKKLGIAGYGDDTPFRLPEFIPIPGKPQGNQTR
ncbi:MAG: Gfo/Idh/MocA family oxidoreductase [Dysgonamonadaceae bacterium]|jgi:predicted dehydrogenase|nr:Gfo/Idh/MocA family oxidoreductase [Dysgonamonadaceae bacterium]